MAVNQIVLLALHRLSSLRLEEKLLLLKEYPHEKAFSGLTRFEAEWLLGRKLYCRSFNPSKMLEQAGDDLAFAEKSGISFCSCTDSNYPSLLKEIYDPPLVLFWKGTLPPGNEDSLAVVGTRKPSLSAEKEAFVLGLDAGRNGIPVISGLAAGVDGAAHKGAVSLKGRTWAVLGTGCDIVYPAAHGKIAKDILAAGGGLISEFFPGTIPCRYNFPKRNRIISGLSTHIVVVQAPRRSGALYTADYALEQGREVLVHRCGLEGTRSEGSASLAEQGARVIGSAADIFPGRIAPPVPTERGFWNTPRTAREGDFSLWRMICQSEKTGGTAHAERMPYYG